jgi:hypothetical protein
MSNCVERVGWLGNRYATVRKALSPLLFHLSRPIGVGLVSFGFWEREGKRCCRGENLLLPHLCMSRGRRRCTVPFKIAPFPPLFLIVDETVLFWTKHVISFKWKWHQKFQFPNQSLIFYLFNQVFSCNFDFKNQFNCIPAK